MPAIVTTSGPPKISVQAVFAGTAAAGVGRQLLDRVAGGRWGVRARARELGLERRGAAVAVGVDLDRELGRGLGDGVGAVLVPAAPGGEEEGAGERSER